MSSLLTSAVAFELQLRPERTEAFGCTLVFEGPCPLHSTCDTLNHPLDLRPFCLSTLGSSVAERSGLAGT